MGSYNKVVRDLIPGMLRGSGHKVVTRTVYGKELLKALRARFDEELAEYDAAVDDAPAAASLVDLVEIVTAMARLRGCNEGKFGQMRAAEVAQHGAFELGIFVVSVE